MNPNGNIKHGHHGSRTYQRWKSMRQRTNPGRSAHHAKYYDGVTCCERWADFEAFLADMGECPAEHTLDRFPNANGNYEPGNCRWATMAEQNANRSNCHMITRDGVTKTATEWAKALGLRPVTVIARLQRGWDHERVLSEAPGTTGGCSYPEIDLTFRGQTKPLVAWAREIGMTPNAFRMRLRLGWSVERALTQPLKARG
jgi:hypothetical protein